MRLEVALQGSEAWSFPQKFSSECGQYARIGLPVA
jgi:hypothetical protein